LDIDEAGAVPTVGIGTINEVERAIHRCQLKGVPSAAWLVEEMQKRQDVTGTARYNHSVGKPDEWRFAWIAIDV
jgi:hypothetical protein